MTRLNSDIVICGAGMAGIAAAYHLAVRHGVKNITLVDERQPLTLTSDKGTAAYRNWWPGPDDTMVRFMNRSIDLLETLAQESDNCFQLNRRGYVFLTAEPYQIPIMKRTATEISALGAGPIREHPGSLPYTPSPSQRFDNLPTGADLLLSPDLIRQQFPFVTEDSVAALHVRRCGWLDPLRLGKWLLDQAQAHGVRLLRAQVTGVSVINNRVQRVQLHTGDQINTNTFVIAAGPYLKRVGAMLGLDLPIFNELHGKIALRDDLGIVPPDAPLMFWNDPVALAWTAAERAQLEAKDETRWLLDAFPAGVHFRPRTDGHTHVLLVIWTYDIKPQEPVWPPQFDRDYPEVLIRGLARMIPGLSAYFGRGREAYVDGGYYCKTAENRPLIGPLPIQGAYIIGALSGYGIMASQAAGELLATHITGGTLPGYASHLRLERYEDAAYQSLMANWDVSSGQL
ncbi:MAG: FAD-dependent oxidoreductase [Candidatus Poribacteria bacterium]|nr:FAD-dependent oxidoreductase [Candidatus Poribacteria bacterium]